MPDTLSPDFARALSLASIPEHSPLFMQIMSGGEALLIDDFLFLTGSGMPGSSRADWLMAVGYRLGLAPGDDLDANARDFSAALDKALDASGAEHCFAMAPLLPAAMRQSALSLEEDIFYALPADTPVPGRLRNILETLPLRVVVGREFTPGHRRLWAEFMGRTALKPNVRELYARTEAVLKASQNLPGADLRLFDALDAEGRVTASLLLDFAPERFVSYVIGAHSRSHYAPHATDLLFKVMLEAARAEGREEIQLGLGVNEGITRFKRKWGGVPALPYAMGEWHFSRRGAASAGGGGSGASRSPSRRTDGVADELVRAMLTPGRISKWEFMLRQPEQRPLAMLWELEKNGRVSWIAGSAHFCRCSFRRSLTRLFEKVDTVIFEGPLDVDSLLETDDYGEIPPPPGERVIDFLTPDDIARLKKRLCAPEWRDYGRKSHRLPEDRLLWFLTETKPWYAFFSLWTAFLERRGWENSVDLEAWELARSMNRVVFGMETIPEQMIALESAPMPRIVRFLRNCDRWDAYRRRNESAYLRGDLEGMMGTSTEFPSRTEQIIDSRDQRFRERMRPWLERGNVAVFVGSAHMLNLRWMLKEDGFVVRRVLPTWRHRLRALWRKPDADLRPAPGAETRPLRREAQEEERKSENGGNGA